MALSLGIPFGLVLIIIGAILFFVTKRKKIAIAIAGSGFVIAVLTLIFLVVVVGSSLWPM